jgi:hypothetical protein
VPAGSAGQLTVPLSRKHQTTPGQATIKAPTYNLRSALVRSIHLARRPEQRSVSTKCVRGALVARLASLGCDSHVYLSSARAC